MKPRRVKPAARAAVSCSIAALLVLSAPAVNADPDAPPAPAPTTTESPPVTLKQYTNPVYRWSITYPEGYTIDTTEPQWIKLRAFEPPRELGVHTMVNSNFGSLDAFVDHQLDFFQHYFESQGLKMQVVSRTAVTLPGGVPGVEVVKDMLPGGRSLDLFVLSGTTGYFFSAETYLQNWDLVDAEFDQTAKSFTLAQ